MVISIAACLTRLVRWPVGMVMLQNSADSNPLGIFAEPSGQRYLRAWKCSVVKNKPGLQNLTWLLAMGCWGLCL